MKNRLKLLREDQNMTQQKFADKLGIKRTTIGNYEVGRNEPVDSVISLICDRFGVNEQWLRTGVGEMYLETKKDDDIDRLINKMLNDETAERKKRLVTAILRLSPEQIEKGVEWMKEAFGLVEEPTAADQKEQEIKDKVESYETELRTEAASEKSEASRTGSEDIADEA